MNKRVYIAGTVDTKGSELFFLRDIVKVSGLDAVVVDLSTMPHAATAYISASDVARHHEGGASAVFTGDRGSAVGAMAQAFARFMSERADVAGAIGIGGSGGTSLVAAGFRELPIGVPKLIISTVASGQVAGYVGPSDIAMMYSVTDLAGLNRISRQILTNAANAVVGMVKGHDAAPQPVKGGDDKPAIGLSMFGVTTPCVNAITAALQDNYDCLVFHATGTGGQSMEKLAESRLLAAVADITTTEVCDLLMGGIFPCTEDRFGAIARSRIPYVGSCGALDMVNFGAPDSVPEKYKDRLFYRHNPQVTLMRTTVAENKQIGAWIGQRLNRCNGPVRFLIPSGGVSLLDAPGQAFHDPAADAALFDALENSIITTEHRRLIRVPFGINDAGFAEAAVTQLKDAIQSSSHAH